MGNCARRVVTAVSSHCKCVSSYRYDKAVVFVLKAPKVTDHTEDEGESKLYMSSDLIIM